MGFVVCVASALLACGGGGGNGSPAAQDKVGADRGSDANLENTTFLQTGQFIDAPVQGLQYRTATQSGSTDATGKFTFLNGETVEFRLYGQPLLSAPGFNVLTPFDIPAGSFNPNYSINLIRFLMTVDEDNIPANGIKLPTYTGAFQINFDQSIASFENDANVLGFISKTTTNRSLVSVQAAVAHIVGSLQNVSTDYKLDLQGKTGRSVMTNSKCSNGLQLGWRYTFGASSVRVVGNDTFITNNNTVCTTNAEETLEVSYAQLRQEDAFLSCAPVCTYAQLNRVQFIPSDADGRTAVEWSWHTPNTKKIYNVKTILLDPRNPGQQAALSTFFEVITLD